MKQRNAQSGIIGIIAVIAVAVLVWWVLNQQSEASPQVEEAIIQDVGMIPKDFPDFRAGRLVQGVADESVEPIFLAWETNLNPSEAARQFRSRINSGWQVADLVGEGDNLSFEMTNETYHCSIVVSKLITDQTSVTLTAYRE